MRVFISFSMKNKRRYRDVCEALQAKGIECCNVDKDLMPGESLAAELRKAIHSCQVCVFIATRKSVTSRWCHAEVGAFWGVGKPVVVYSPDENLPEADFPPQIEGAYRTGDLENIVKTVEGRLADHRKNEFYLCPVYPERDRINWHELNSKLKKRFWACGTSLTSLIKGNRLEGFLRQGVNDIRILLPNVDGSGLHSSMQLAEYNAINNADDKDAFDQVEEARTTYKRFEQIFTASLGQLSPAGQLSDVLRRYRGTMYSNITIYDDVALIAPYDRTGLGMNSVTIRAERQAQPAVFDSIVACFESLWRASLVVGTGIIFLNDQNQVLLFQRDDSPKIPAPNLWDILGGHKKPRETPEMCIVREMEEEICQKIPAPVLFRRYDLPDRTEYIYWQNANWDIRSIDLREGKCLKWFSREDIEKMTDAEIAFGFRKVLLDFFEEIPSTGEPR